MRSRVVASETIVDVRHTACLVSVGTVALTRTAYAVHLSSSQHRMGASVVTVMGLSCWYASRYVVRTRPTIVLTAGTVRVRPVWVDRSSFQYLT